MYNSYIVLTPPAAEPVTLSDVKNWLRLDFSDDDSLITELISDARRMLEEHLRLSLPTQTIQAVYEFEPVAAGPISGPVDQPFDTWKLAERPDIPLFGNALVRIPTIMGPVQSLTTVEYQLTRMDNPEWTLLPTTDVNGDPTYRLDSYALPGEVNIFTILAAERFRLTYTAGYATLPNDLRRKLMKLIAFLYDNREAPVPPALLADVGSTRVFML